MWRIFAVAGCLLAVGVIGQYEWQARDAFDEVSRYMKLVNKDNCEIQHVSDLYLPENSVSHLPDIKDVNINPVFPNRTQLLHIHNIALNRAFFWSYILQSRFIRPAINDTYDPGMMYYFLSTVADVSTNKHINASAVYFAPNMSYSSSYKGFFNKTFPRFAPRTFRADDFNDPIHLERISTLNTFIVQDLGAIKPDTSSDYTSEYYRINEWYKKWLPDNVVGRHDTKTTYQVQIRYANNTNETFTFHGPPGADEVPGPVQFTRPYFDCGRSNRWLVAAVVPIADIYPRHTGFRHVEYPTYTAASVVEMDFERIDINQCPESLGNNGPNIFADTARCKQETTECEPIHGWGFRRGGYQCRCKPGYRLPLQTRRPFLGELVERATAEQYFNGFDCLSIGWIQKLPVKWEKASPYIRDLYLHKYPEYLNQTKGPKNLNRPNLNIHRTLDFILQMNKDNCKDYKQEELVLHGGVMYGAEEFFQNEAKMALRLANFISAFLQVSDPNEVFSGKRVADRPLTEDQMIGETLALVLGDSRIWSAGVYWERNKFTNRTLFAPYAYKKILNTRKFFLEDLARLNKSEEVYLNKEWFKFLKYRWASNFDDLEKFWMKIRIRFNQTGETTRKYEHFPNYYREPDWSMVTGQLLIMIVMERCPCGRLNTLPHSLDGTVSKLNSNLSKGVVSVTMDLLKLDINQCTDDYWVANAFKDTNKCDQKTSYCVPILGRGFEAGGYKCECKQGFEYPFEDPITYYDGQLVEAEFSNLVDNNETRFDMFKCRLAGASGIQASLISILALLFVCFQVYR
ncbi:hypothetical protein NQ317_009807 [Molorchus minor]|uniref:GPR158/179 extracellular domain-containing protein n=1 Tax=Molorchus minor TaxID=1323400 RepID=A0ABQ9JW25_9CUCU|nr:hypothetical protein NQ317_009807 [Molorchus minor]